MDPDPKAQARALLATARRAREGRDLWREVGPVLAELRRLNVTYREISEKTGISVSTIARFATSHTSAPPMGGPGARVRRGSNPLRVPPVVFRASTSHVAPGKG